jgi:hypothetical protein
VASSARLYAGLLQAEIEVQVAATEPKLKAAISHTKKRQECLAAAISELFGGKQRVNVVGDINTI